MSSLLSSITGGSSGFSTRFISGFQIISSGVTGDLVTITPSAGRKVKLSTLQTNNTTTLQAGISISIGGTDIITEKILGGGNSADEFIIGVQATDSVLTPGRHLSIQGNTDEVVKIVKNAGNTGVDIYYAYEFGE